MNLSKIASVVAAFTVFSTAVFAQADPSPTPTSTPRLSESLSKNFQNYPSGEEIAKEKRAEAYARLMEAQRYIWRGNASRSQNVSAPNYRSARAALVQAIEIHPRLAEAYTALAELTLNLPPNDVDEAIALASIATKIEPNNYGAHRILARLNTYKSKLNNGVLDIKFAESAIAEWKEITRLDPRNAEAWAFLSEFYDQTNDQTSQINAIKKWVSAASPLDTGFYRRVMGAGSDLSPESASFKLGQALIRAGRPREAVEILSLVIADEPENQEAIELLKEALESVDDVTASTAIESLKQAVYANPENAALLTLLAQVQWRAGKKEESIKGLAAASEKIAASNKALSSNLQISIGDLYAGADRYAEAVTAYEKALKIRELDSIQTIAESDREFALTVFEKLIQVYKKANKTVEAKALILRARKLFGKDDLFADKQMISLYRETGRKAEALAAIRALRTGRPDDYGLLRLEASILTENGRVDEAVSLVKNQLSSASAGGRQAVSGEPSFYDDFSNLLFISQLYNEANRGKDAIASARQAYDIAEGEERKQIAKLTIASAQQMSGDYAGAEETLVNILKQTPRNPIALNNLGYFLLERNERFEEALNFIQQAVKIDPYNPSYLDSLGWAYYKLGKYPEAEKYLRDAARIDITSSTIQEHLGDVYQKQGKSELARSSWNKALQLGASPIDLDRLKNKLGIKTSR